jgi:nitrogen fixation NifU-like protein
LDALYRDVVLEHYRHPRHRTPLAEKHGSALVHNPLCGDQVRVEVRLAGDVVDEIAAMSRGCSIVVAAGSVMTDVVRGHDRAAIERLHAALQRVVAGTDRGADLPESLRAFARLKDLPSRRQCALVPWEALEAALADCATQVPAG